MRIDLQWTPPALLALLVAACIDIPDPQPRMSMPPGESMPPDGKDDPKGEDPPGADPWVPPPIVRLSCRVEGQTFPDGSPVPADDSCNSCTCFDGSVLCSNIVCEPEGCDASLEKPDGVCSRPPEDPCIDQDPDCKEAPPEPVPDEVLCDAGGESFPDGAEVPSGDSCNTCSCDEGGVRCTEIACDPVFCAEFVEELDGICSRFPLDPCRAQDPDCTGSPLPPLP